MNSPLTKLEKGILVEISDEQLKVLLDIYGNAKGYLEYDAYPDEYKKIAFPNEVGRFLYFRILKKNEEKNEKTSS